MAQIITFGTMAARAAVRDVGRVLSMPYGEVDKIAKMIPLSSILPLKKLWKNRLIWRNCIIRTRKSKSSLT